MNTLLTLADIEYLRGQQMKLDGEIIRNNSITHDEWMEGFKTKHYLALRVEVHEFINECYDQFKYWKKKPIDRERIVDEAVDVLHFVVLHWNKGSRTAEENQSALYGCLHNIDADFYLNTEKKLEFLSQDWGINNTLAGVLSVLNDYNFTSKDIIEAYNRKNAINFERLESGY